MSVGDVVSHLLIKLPRSIRDVCDSRNWNSVERNFSSGETLFEYHMTHYYVIGYLTMPPVYVHWEYLHTKRMSTLINFDSWPKICLITWNRLTTLNVYALLFICAISNWNLQRNRVSRHPIGSNIENWDLWQIIIIVRSSSTSTVNPNLFYHSSEMHSLQTTANDWNGKKISHHGVRTFEVKWNEWMCPEILHIYSYSCSKNIQQPVYEQSNTLQKRK